MNDFPMPEKVRILLTEYSALRAEIVARMNHGYQLLVVAVAAMAFFATLWTNSTWQMLSLVGTLMALGYAFACWFILRDIHKLASRLREIEIDVNDRAGEDLLLWENLSGGAKTGFWGGVCRLPRHMLKQAPNPVHTRKGETL